jgi:Na+/proline symporter
MATVFPTGVIGLVVAAILAASLSSIDSAINSCTSIIIIDFYNRLYLRRQVVAPARQSGEAKHDDSSDPGQARQLLVSRIATVCIGVVGIAIAANVSRIGIVLQIGAKVIQTFTGPILGIYLLGMFTKRTNSIGVLIGGVLGTALALFVAFGQTRAFGSEIICFIWPTVFGLVGTLIFGYLASLLAPGSVSAEQQQLTWRNVMKQPLPESSELGRRSEPEAAAVAS